MLEVAAEPVRQGLEELYALHLPTADGTPLVMVRGLPSLGHWNFPCGTIVLEHHRLLPPSNSSKVHLGVDIRGKRFKLEQQAVNDATFSGHLIDDHPGCTLATRLRTDLDVAALAGEW